MAVICLCARISERKINKAIDRGALTTDAVVDACGAGSQCGGCRPAIDGIVAERTAAAPVTPRLA